MRTRYRDAASAAEHQQPTEPASPPIRAAAVSLGWCGLMVFFLALGLRAGWGLYRMSTVGPAVLEFPDEQQYWLMASSLRHGKGLQDELGFRAGRMPLYPGLLSVVAGSQAGIAAAKVVQWLIGAIGALLAARLGARVGGRSVGLLTGLTVAADPFLVFFSNLVLTETLFVTLLVALWSTGARWVTDGGLPLTPRVKGQPGLRPWWVWAVLSLACVYARESTLGLIVAVLLVHLAWRRFDRRACLGTLLVGGVLAAGLFPWALRNRLVIGEWYWLTTRAGISLYDGVGPQASGAADLGDVKGSEAVRGLSEVEYNRYFLRKSWEALHADPGRIAWLAVRKFTRMWNPVPNVAEYQSRMVRLISAGWMVPLLCLALAGTLMLRRMAPARAGPIVVYLLLPAVYLTVLHMVFVGSVRYRLGAMPMLAVLAAVALTRCRAATNVARHRKPPC